MIANFRYFKTHLIHRETITNETVYQLSVYITMSWTGQGKYGYTVRLDIAISAEDLMIK